MVRADQFYLRTKSDMLVLMLVNVQEVQRFEFFPPQELNRHSRDLRHQVNEESLRSASRKETVEKDIKMQLQLTQKETSQAEKLLEDQLEVGQTLNLFQSGPDQSHLPTKLTETDVFKLILHQSVDMMMKNPESNAVQMVSSVISFSLRCCGNS